MNLMLYGNSGSGKTTLAELISEYGFTHINTGKITRLMADMDCHNLPVIVQTMISTMVKTRDHIFDHFYTHTFEQLTDLGFRPIVIELIDNRTCHGPLSSKKRARFSCQDQAIQNYFSAHDIVPYVVFNTDYGFDVSELIRADILPFECPAVLKPGESFKQLEAR